MKTRPTKERHARRIYSHVLNAYLWVVADDGEADALRVSGEAIEPVYTMAEAQELKKLDKSELPAVHMVKQVFFNARSLSDFPT